MINLGGLLSLFSKDRALIDTVDSKNAAARGVVYDPSRGIRDIMYYPQSTLIAGAIRLSAWWRLPR